MQPSDIDIFLQKSERKSNDKANKIRENILGNMNTLSEEYYTDKTYGAKWTDLKNKWNDALIKIAKTYNINTYTSYISKIKGGRGNKFDIELTFQNNLEIYEPIKLEFKYGASKIDKLPQFLSLDARFPMFEETYDKFYYEEYLDSYIKCDPGITTTKPLWEQYKKQVVGTNYDVSPFFRQLKEREGTEQKKKFAIVAKSIATYLEKYGEKIIMNELYKKIHTTQTEKVFLLWNNNSFHIDTFKADEVKGLKIQKISNKNRIDIENEDGTVVFGLLLRWRNHKGVLKPAWQISMKRQLL